MTPIREIENMHKVNFFNQMLFSQMIIKNMIKNKGGSIVNIASSAAIDANEGRLAYVTSKASIMSASKVLARELAPFNIRSNCIAPGLTETNLMRENILWPNLQLHTQITFQKMSCTIEILKFKGREE